VKQRPSRKCKQICIVPEEDNGKLPVTDIGKFCRCRTTKLQLIAEPNLQWQGRSHCVTIAYRAEVGTPCVSVLLLLLLPSLSVSCEVFVMMLVLIVCCGHSLALKNHFTFSRAKFFRAFLTSASIHFAVPNGDQWRTVPGASVRPIIMEGNRSILEPVAVLPVPTIDSIYQWSNTLLKKNYCLVSRLV
jgi:hypothetical protein